MRVTALVVVAALALGGCANRKVAGPATGLGGTVAAVGGAVVVGALIGPAGNSNDSAEMLTIGGTMVGIGGVLIIVGVATAIRAAAGASSPAP